MAINIHVGTPPEETKTKAKLKIRKAVDGSLMIQDHEEIDIVVVPEKYKVITFASDQLDDNIYEIQSDLMKFLSRKGLIELGSIRAGNIYGSLEGKIMASEEVNSVDMTILNIAKWVESEKPYYDFKEDAEEEVIDNLTDPPADESTPLGQVPHEKSKGARTNYLSMTQYHRPYEE